MASKVGSNGKRTCNAVAMEDVQGDNRWMDMVRIFNHSEKNKMLLFNHIIQIGRYTKTALLNYPEKWRFQQTVIYLELIHIENCCLCFPFHGSLQRKKMLCKLFAGVKQCNKQKS